MFLICCQARRWLHHSHSCGDQTFSLQPSKHSRPYLVSRDLSFQNLFQLDCRAGLRFPCPTLRGWGKSSACPGPLLLSWMACLYGWFCHQPRDYEHSHCYCLTAVNQLKTNCGVPEKYFISCNETGLQSWIWLPDWKDYKEQWFWTSLHISLRDLNTHRVRKRRTLCLSKLTREYICPFQVGKIVCWV